MSTEQHPVEDTLRAAGWFEDDLRNVRSGEKYYDPDSSQELTRLSQPTGSDFGILRAPRPEPEYQFGDIRILTVRDCNPAEAVFVRSSGIVVWLPLDNKTSGWLSRTPDDPSIIAIEARPQDQPQTAPPRMVADLREFPGRVALDKGGDPWTALPGSGVIVAQAIVQDSEAELPVRWGPYRWADEASS